MSRLIRWNKRGKNMQAKKKVKDKKRGWWRWHMKKEASVKGEERKSQSKALFSLFFSVSHARRRERTIETISTLTTLQKKMSRTNIFSSLKPFFTLWCYWWREEESEKSEWGKSTFVECTERHDKWREWENCMKWVDEVAASKMLCEWETAERNIFFELFHALQVEMMCFLFSFHLQNKFFRLHSTECWNLRRFCNYLVLLRQLINDFTGCVLLWTRICFSIQLILPLSLSPHRKAGRLNYLIKNSIFFRFARAFHDWSEKKKKGANKDAKNPLLLH